jgi:hypothetical protein
MKKRIIALLLTLALSLGLLTGCAVVESARTVNTPSEDLVLIEDEDKQSNEITGTDRETPLPEDGQDQLNEEEPAQENDGAEGAEIEAVSEDGEYTSPEEVAEYIHTYGHLPSNFITKNEAKELGWDSAAGNLWDVAPGKSIGGDRFGNYEGLLPEGRWKECDVNYSGGYRGSDRLVFNADGAVYYTSDHYKSFTQLY